MFTKILGHYNSLASSLVVERGEPRTRERIFYHFFVLVMNNEFRQIPFSVISC